MSVSEPGDVILGNDGFWEMGSDSPGSDDVYATVEVGFLSVPDAKTVAEQICSARAAGRWRLVDSVTASASPRR